MAFQKQNYFQRRTKPKGPRSNDRIRATQVQVIGSDGKNLGTLNTQEAISIARNEGLDLIEISPNASPPVCRIIDIGKYKYDLQKKTNKAKKKQKIINLKEIKDNSITIRKLGSEKQETLPLDQAIKIISQQNKFPIN